MKKTYLLTPGPTPIPELISAGFAEPLIHHRTPAFEKLMGEVREGLKYLFQTSQEVILLAATGTGAMEAAVTNLFSPCDAVIVVNAGKFGERWGKLAKHFGLTVYEIALKAGDSVEPAQVREAFQKHGDARAILFQGSETSTGARMPVREICEIARQHGALSVCDGITSCGVMSMPMDAWDIDVMITGSQKALMIPPGLAMIALSERAWEQTTQAKLPRFYFDLAREKKAHLKNQTAWTPAISLIQGLHKALAMIREEGLDQVFKRHDLLALATREAVTALGLEVLAKKSPSSSVTAVIVPASITDGKKIPKTLRDKYGVVIAGGQDELEGKIFRLAHFGYVSTFDITTALSALELTLHDLGYPVKFGTGVGRALQVFSQNPLG